MFPDWIEAELQALAADTVDTEAGAWRKAMRVGRLLAECGFSPRSKELAALRREIATMGRCGREAQRRYQQVYEVLSSGGELTIPRNLHFSTVYELVKRGADLEVIRRADAEGWSLKDARRWGIGRIIDREQRPPTFWRHLTRTVDSDIRRATGPLSPEQEQRLRQQVVAAVREWADGADNQEGYRCRISS